jgi:hypothetical protein
MKIGGKYIPLRFIHVWFFHRPATNPAGFYFQPEKDAPMQKEQEQQKTIVTRVPPTLATEVEKAAAKELLSVSSFVRRLLLIAVSAEGHKRAA